jgi:hypothetical protein
MALAHLSERGRVKSKPKGDAWERAVVAELRACGHPHAERAYRLGVHDDRGDVNGIVGWLLECKDCARHELGVWMDEAKSEAERNAVTPALVVKRKRAPASRAYVVLELATFARLLCELDGRA